MNALVFDRRLVLPRPGLLVLRAGFGVVVPLAIAAWLVDKGISLTGPLFCALFAVGQLAFAVTTAHKELLAAGPSFFHARLRRKVWSAQLVWALGEATAVAGLLVLAYPEAGPAVAVSSFGAALGVHALAALATLHLTWSYQLPFWIYYLFYAVPWLGRLGDEGRLAPILAAPWYWLAGAGLLLWRLGRVLGRPDLHRRLCGTLVLGPDDLLRPSRLIEYRRTGDLRRQPGQGARWRARLIDALIGRADRARQGGHVVAARNWQLVALDAAVNLTPRTRVMALVVVSTLAFMVIGGYYDSLNRLDSLHNWFAGLAYQFALFPFWSLGVVMLVSQHGAFSRRSAFSAELGAFARLTAVALAAAVVMAGVFALMAAVLPPVTWKGQELVFTAPRLYGILLAPLLGSLAWLTVAIRPRPQCTITNFVLGPGFIGGQVLMTSLPYATAVPLCVGISVAAFALAYALRRRWWERADLAAA